MFDKSISATKEKIFRTAAVVFSKVGYDNISMEDLAGAVGIRHPMIYKHFQNKKEVLTGLYQAYADQQKRVMPDLHHLLKMAEVKSPAEVLLMTGFFFPKDVAEMMNSILTIAARSITTNADSRQFIVDNIFSTTDELLVPVI